MLLLLLSFSSYPFSCYPTPAPTLSLPLRLPLPSTTPTTPTHPLLQLLLLFLEPRLKPGTQTFGFKHLKMRNHAMPVCQSSHRSLQSPSTLSSQTTHQLSCQARTATTMSHWASGWVFDVTSDSFTHHVQRGTVPPDARRLVGDPPSCCRIEATIWTSC